jgi:transposase
LQGFSYREIEKRLEVSTSFIAQTQRKYLSLGSAGLKLKYQASKSYLTTEQLSSTIQGLYRVENRNISELERYLMTNYDVVFKSRESYYRILKAGQLSWQKANVENSRKQPDII